MPRLKVFIDAQNVYRDARRSFFSPVDPSFMGQISPRRFGEAVTGSRKEPAGRKLTEVRIYTGRPSSARDSKTYGAHMRQCARWGSDRDVLVIARSLRYSRNWPAERPQEKGIDVHLAVDLVRGYALGDFDIGVVASTDTDLVPALEAVFDLDRGLGYAPIEACAWFEEGYSKQLRVTGREIYCHEFPRQMYERVADLTDYNVR